MGIQSYANKIAQTIYLGNWGVRPLPGLEGEFETAFWDLTMLAACYNISDVEVAFGTALKLEGSGTRRVSCEINRGGNLVIFFYWVGGGAEDVRVDILSLNRDLKSTAGGAKNAGT